MGQILSIIMWLPIQVFQFFNNVLSTKEGQTSQATRSLMDSRVSDSPTRRVRTPEPSPSLNRDFTHMHSEEGDAERVSTVQTPLPELGNNGSNMEQGQAPQAPIGGNTQRNSETHQTFALVIGINEYQWVQNKNLLRAVPDAENFKKYLVEKQQVPEDHITCLYDGVATRSAIIEGFRKLEEDEKIIPGQVAIIIYFAGHGAVVTKPDTWENWEVPDGQVEMLCPADINGVDTNGKTIEGIPDRTISRLLLDLSNAKGDNITLILDCCHAAGANRGLFSPPPDQRSRAIRSQDIKDFKLSSTCDQDIHSRESQPRLVEDGKSGFSDSFGSHVLLAACERKQTAWEDNNNGIFTAALLNSLERFALKGHIPTYDSLMRALKMPSYQTVHWDGKHVCRRLFDCWKEPANSSLIPCRKGDTKHWPSDLILCAGLLHGIKENSTFEIFELDPCDANDTKDALANLSVKEVKMSISRLQLHPSSDSAVFTSNSEWYARLRKASGPPLNIYSNEDNVLADILDDSDESRLTAHVVSVQNQDDADLCLTKKEDIVLFHRGKRFSNLSSCSPPLPSYRVYRMADIRDFINRYAHFNSHLIMESPLPITDFVTIEMIKLGDHQEVVLNNGGCIKTSLGSSKQDFYGFTIHSKYDTGLHVYLLYFDASECKIETWYSSQKGQFEKSVNPCLEKPGSKLTLGHGRHNMDSLEFTIPNGQDVDVCFIKIVVSTKAVDISPIGQYGTYLADARSRSGKRVPYDVDVKWASAIFTVESKRVSA